MEGSRPHPGALSFATEHDHAGNAVQAYRGSRNDPDICSTFLQPILAKALGKGRTLTVNSESS